MNIHAGSNLARQVDIDAVIEGTARLNAAQARALYERTPLHELGRWATARANHILGGHSHYRTYVIDRNINYTNVCSADCTFCAFKRDLGEADSYVLSEQELHGKIQELVDIGGTQVLLQGGMHPELGLDFYERMLRAMKQAFPQVHIHGFSPPELVEFVAIFDIPGFPTPGVGRSDQLDRTMWCEKLRMILQRLMAAGLDSVPGGGGEIFAHHARRRIGIGKATATQWLDTMTVAQELGMFTSATMMFGHIEGIADRIDHMLQVRQRQDEAIERGLPGRYVSFIAWPFQRENTPLGRLREWDRDDPEMAVFPGDALADALAADPALDEKHAANTHPVAALAGKRLRSAAASDYLRTQALARLVLDNIHSIGASWVTMGPKIGQLGLMFGATDMGSVMMEENVVSAAGTTYRLTEPLLCHLIRSAGFTPAQRDNRYHLLHVHDGPDSPDHRVNDWSTQRGEAPGGAAAAVGAADAAGVTLTIDGHEG